MNRIHNNAVPRTLAAVLCVLLPTGAAWAEEHGGGSPMDSGSVYNALWAIGLFLVLLAVLTRLAWRPVITGMQQREQRIAETISRAEAQNAESQRLLAEYQARLEAADKEAAERLAEARRQAAEARETILAAARAEAEDVTKRARNEIDAARQSALDELYGFAAELATTAAEKIIRRNIGPADQSRLIAESLEQIRARARRV